MGHLSPFHTLSKDNMFNQGNFKAICELAEDLKSLPNKSTLEKMSFKPYDKFDTAIMTTFPKNLYEVGERHIPQIGEEIRFDNLLITKVDMESKLTEKKLSPEQQLLSENLMKTWSKDR
jgi:hypothetical protein